MRVTDWEDRLAFYGTHMHGLPYEWGVTDCASVALNGLAIMLGRDLAPWWERYDEAKAAAQPEAVFHAMDDLGGMKVQGILARSGDVFVTFKDDDWPEVHLVIGKRGLTSSHEDGVHMVRLSDLLADKCRHCWRFL